MARKLPPFRFKKAAYASSHPGSCRKIKTPSGVRYLCRISGGSAKKTAARRKTRRSRKH